MKIRIDNETYEWLTLVHRALCMSRAEVVRRCLRRWRSEGSQRVEQSFFDKTATRQESEVYELNLGGMEVGLRGAEVRAITRWRLAQLDWEQIETGAEIRRKAV